MMIFTVFLTCFGASMPVFSSVNPKAAFYYADLMHRMPSEEACTVSLKGEKKND